MVAAENTALKEIFDKRQFRGVARAVAGFIRHSIPSIFSRSRSMASMH
jgi:hypothetical protein